VFLLDGSGWRGAPQAAGRHWGTADVAPFGRRDKCRNCLLVPAGSAQGAHIAQTSPPGWAAARDIVALRNFLLRCKKNANMLGIALAVTQNVVRRLDPPPPARG
jgi:hypothetical protein